jgi:hypothetical protein
MSVSLLLLSLLSLLLLFTSLSLLSLKPSDDGEGITGEGNVVDSVDVIGKVDDDVDDVG